MNKILLSIFFLVLFVEKSFSEEIKKIYEGKIDAKIEIIIFESLTCGHCANFHKNVYPDLKKNFIDKGTVKIEFRNFPLDMAALNASKISHCKNDGDSKILHLLFDRQNEWVKGSTVEDANTNLKILIKKHKLNLEFDKCINNKYVEDHVLQGRIDAVKKFNINATPTLIINNKKFEKPLTYKNLKKAIEKLI